MMPLLCQANFPNPLRLGFIYKTRVLTVLSLRKYCEDTRRYGSQSPLYSICHILRGQTGNGNGNS